MKIYYSLQKLVAEGRRRSASLTVVSFDLFDTLLVRRIHDPDLVKLPVARYISALAAQAGLNWSWNRVQNLRDDVEKHHRQKTGEEFEDREACYPRFMAETLAAIFEEKAAPGLLAQVTDYELAMESTMLVPRAEFVAWLKELKAQGKRIFIMSDIYLPAAHLERLAKFAGLMEYAEAVISSADTFLAKASGKAFPLLQEKYRLDKGSWLHVGDNPISDGLRPAEFGIQALVLHDGTEKWRKAIIKRQYNYGDGRPFWRGRALQQLMMPLEGENEAHHPLYVEGYNFFAPLLGAFVQRIAERCRELKIRKVFFLSREGWTFKKVWEAAMPTLFPDGRLPEIDYLYVSRMALAGASCARQGLTRTNGDIAFLPLGNADFRDVCRIFDLDPGPLAPHLQRHHLTAETTLSPHHQGYDPKNRLRFNEMLEDDAFQAAVKEQVRTYSDALQRYLEERGFFGGGDVALVDIGWLGTIQRFLYEAIAHREDRPRCHGFLFCATRGIPYPTTPDNYIEGVLYDRNRFDLAGSSILYARDIFEEACRAPHPTLNRYRLTGQGYELEFRRTDDATGRAEHEQDLHYTPLQEGILDGARRYGAASALLGYSLDDYKPWLNYLMTSKLAFPRTAEILELKHRHHLDDFHGGKRPLPQYAKSQQHLWDRTRTALLFSPLLRTRYFLHHIKDRLNE
ncbi:MAG: HAD family hydrolase [Desulfobulbaceae bacterium]